MLQLNTRADASEVRLEGSTTLQPVLEELVDGFLRSWPGVEIDVSGGGSGRGIAALLENDSQIAASSRFLKAEEIAAFRLANTLPVPFQIAYDAIIPIVHKSNRIKTLSLKELGQIYRGEIDNWRQLGGPDRAIVTVIRDSSSGTFQIWQERVTGGVSQPASGIYADSNDSVVREVAKHRGAIGYIGLASLNASVRPLQVEGIFGSMDNVRSGGYPLGRPLFLFTAGWPEGEVLEFINFVLDPGAGQRIIEDEGLIPLYRHNRR